MKSSDLPGILYADPSLEGNGSESCAFALSVHRSGYNLLICNSHSRKILLASSITGDDSDDGSALLLRDLPLLPKVIPNSAAGVLFFYTEKAILVPGNTTGEEEAAAAWSLHFNTESECRICTSPLSSPEATLVWKPSGEVIDAVQKIFQNLLPRHAGALLFGTDYPEKFHNPSCGVILDNQSMLAHVSVNGNTLFFNGFSFASTDELIYFIAAVAGNTGFVTSSSDLILYGPAPRSESLLQQLRQLFPNARYGDNLPALAVLPPEERHRFYLTARYFHCES
jgi:hypothetical protein